jgi:hypothetical protein
MNLTDAGLNEEIARGGGYGRAAGYLIQLPEGQREAAYSEGTIQANMSGDRMASGVYTVVRRFLSGDTSTPLTDWNREMCAKEREGKVRPGTW